MGCHKPKACLLCVASIPFTKKALKKLDQLEQNWNTTNVYDRNALWYACRYGSFEMVEFLWWRTDDKHVQSSDIDEECHNLLEVALYFNPRPKVLQFLLSKLPDLPVCQPINLIKDIPSFIPQHFNRLKIIKTICRKISLMEESFGSQLFDCLLSAFKKLHYIESDYILKQMSLKDPAFVLSSNSLVNLFEIYHSHYFFELLLDHSIDVYWVSLSSIFYRYKFDVLEKYIFNSLERYNIPPLKDQDVEIQEIVITSLMITNYNNKDVKHYLQSLVWLDKQGVNLDLPLKNRTYSKEYFKITNLLNF